MDGTVRYLRNVMGLWLLQESLRTWEDGGAAVPLDRLLPRGGGRARRGVRLIDPDDPTLLPPGRHARAHRRRLPADRAAAAADPGRDGAVHPRQPGAGLPPHRPRRRSELAGRQVDVVHLVGGGARNELLCQLTADACGLPVEAGPVEAAALGNVLVQARAVGAVPPTSPACGRCSAAPSRCGATSPAVPPPPGTTPSAGCTPAATH